MKRILVILFFLYTSLCCSNNCKVIPFKTGDSVCFVGNSITHQGDFFHNILLYHMTRFPDKQVTFYNCGIAGDVAAGVLDRLDRDILVNNPSYAIIMLAMNDVDRSLYGPLPTNNTDTLEKRKEAISTYKKNMETIVRTFLAKDIKVILQTPSIYDQTVVNGTTNNLGVNDALEKCAAYSEELAVRYQLPLVDYWNRMNLVNLGIQNKDPKSSLVGKDRVHPGNTGHFIMSYQFLTNLGASQYVSQIIIGRNRHQSMRKSVNCQIHSLQHSENITSFSVTENALPFPALEIQQEVMELIPFERDLNMELLRIEGLRDEGYALYIDSIYIGNFSGHQLGIGINLANFSQTPQYQQAMQVRSLLEEHWENEKKIRDLKFIEANRYFKLLKETTGNNLSKHSLDSIFSENYTSNLSYRLSKSKEYFENKPIEKQLHRRMKAQLTEAYGKAQPVEHKYLVKRTISNKVKS